MEIKVMKKIVSLVLMAVSLNTYAETQYRRCAGRA